MARSSLGKGLGALIPPRVATPQPIAELGERVQSIPSASVKPSPLQPRKQIAAAQLEELAQSIRERGILQPLIVRKRGAEFELIAGERRWRAAVKVGLAEVPVIVREASDREVLEWALIENLQREDLNPLEEAAAYARLHDEFGMTQEAIAQGVGKSRASVANSMRLLGLPEDVRDLLRAGVLSVGHAKVLLALKNEEEQSFWAKRTVKENLSVRALERLTTAPRGASPSRRPKESPSLAPNLLAIQNRLTHRLSTRVEINHTPKRGTILIEYYGEDDLDRLLRELGISLD